MEKENATPILRCPECNSEVWDMPHGHKLAKCWECGIAFDTMTDDENDDE